ncbi:MAG: hypothetical protein U1F57_12220 [bacterium]
MTSPLRILAQSVPPPAKKEENVSPELKTAQDRHRKAGFARNQAEAAYKQAVKEHGANSEEAKGAKEALGKAQAEVEAAQKEVSTLLKSKPTAKADKSASTPQKKAGEKGSAKTDKPAQTGVKKGESEKDILYRFEIIEERVIEFKIDEKVLKDLEKRIKDLLRQTEPKNHGEMLRRSSFRTMEMMRK